MAYDRPGNHHRRRGGAADRRHSGPTHRATKRILTNTELVCRFLSLSVRPFAVSSASICRMRISAGQGHIVRPELVTQAESMDDQIGSLDIRIAFGDVTFSGGTDRRNDCHYGSGE